MNVGSLFSGIGGIRERWGASQAGRAGWWAAEPDVGRVAHGVPARLDRLGGLGNAVVPQVVEWIGRRMMAHAALECALSGNAEVRTAPAVPERLPGYAEPTRDTRGVA